MPNASTHILGHSHYEVPSFEDTIDLNLRLGRRTNPAIRCGGVSLNTSKLTASEAEQLIARETARLGLPVADPIRGGEAFARLVQHCVKDAR